MTDGLRIFVGPADPADPTSTARMTEYTDGFTDGAQWHGVTPESVAVQKDVINKQSRLACTLAIGGAEVDPPAPLEAVVMTVDGAPVYGGVLGDIQGAQRDPNAQGVILYPLQADGWQRWADRHLVNQYFAEQSADAIVRWMLANTLNVGLNLFTGNNIQAAPSVPGFRADGWTFSRVMDHLAGQLSWTWDIRYDPVSGSLRDVYFYAAMTLHQSPLPNNTLDADTLDPSLIVWGGDLELTSTATQFRDVVTCRDYKVSSGKATPPATLPINQIGDGTTTTFQLPAEPAGSTSGYFPQGNGTKGILVGGVLYTCKADVATGLPGSSTTQDSTAYINKPNQTMRFNVPPAAGVPITGNMYYAYLHGLPQPDGVAIAQAKVLTGTDGVFESVIRDARMGADDDSLAIAEALLALIKYGRNAQTGDLAAYVGQFTSYLQGPNALDPTLRGANGVGWDVGQYFTFTSTSFYCGPGRAALTFTAYVTSLNLALVNHPHGGTPFWRHTVHFADRPFVYN